MWRRIFIGAWFGVFASAVIAATAGWIFQLLPIEQAIAHVDSVSIAMQLWLISLPGAAIAGGLIAYVSRP